MLTIKLDDGRIFPQYQGEPLSWSIGLYHTNSEEIAGFPRMRAVIRAMMAHRPEYLERERRDLLKASFDRIFGHNAARELAVIESEIAWCYTCDRPKDDCACVENGGTY